MMRKLFAGGKIPDDHFAVLKSVLHHSLWSLDDILQIRDYDIGSKRKRRASIRKFNNNESHALTKRQFSQHKKRCCKTPWKTPDGLYKGIPQGLAVSGVLSNIYMLDCDRLISEAVGRANGLYARYCDDFIVVLPWENREAAKVVFDIMRGIPGVSLHSDKTHQFHVYGSRIACCDDGKHLRKKSSVRSKLTFLGFDFDGNVVTLRAGTTGRFFNRYYRRMRKLKKKGRVKKKQRVAIYRTFSEKGRKRNGENGGFGNFLSYVERAQRAFPDDPISKPFAGMYRRLKRDLSGVDG